MFAVADLGDCSWLEVTCYVSAFLGLGFRASKLDALGPKVSGLVGVDGSAEH